MIKRILVGLAGTEYTPTAIRHGVELAQSHGAELTGVTVMDTLRLSATGPVPIGAGGAAKELLDYRLRVSQEQIDAAVNAFSMQCEAANVSYSVRKEEGNPFALMTDEARYHDLMIFGLKDLFEHDVVPEPPDELIKMIQSGVRPILAVSKEYRPVRRVMVAYSGSMESAKTMKQFVQMGLWSNVNVMLVTCDLDPQTSMERLDPAAKYMQAHGITPELRSHVDHPKRQLLHIADDWDADLVVMGNSAHSLLLRRILGETALHVIRHCDRSLFLSQ